jgi:diketogulonate reductase-like aldo/keto reductase
MMQAVEASLKRLQTDYIDLYGAGKRFLRHFQNAIAIPSRIRAGPSLHGL